MTRIDGGCAQCWRRFVSVFNLITDHMILFCCVLDTDAFNIKTVKLKTLKKSESVRLCFVYCPVIIEVKKKHGQWRLFLFDTWVKVCLFVCMCACVCYEISINIRLQRLSETHPVAGQFIERISLSLFRSHSGLTQTSSHLPIRFYS